MQGFLTAEAAADRLGVQRQTLYAYVSRGLVQSKQSDEGRSRLYRLADIEELEQRKEQRRRPAKALREALHFGSPLLESSLTLIRDGRIFYRGRDAVELSRSHSLEQVTAWFWLHDFEAAPELFPSSPPLLPELVAGIASQLPRPGSVEHLQILVPVLAEDDPRAWASTQRSELAVSGARLLQHAVSLVVPNGSEDKSLDGSSIAARLASAWTSKTRTSKTGTSKTGTFETGASKIETDPARRLLDAALILCADHELNVSSFTARCVASAGSPLHSAVSAGLAALHGFRHGGHTRRVEAMLREAESPSGVHQAMADRLRRGEPAPGFGQVLYPDGDPRHIEIIQRIGELFPGSIALEWADALQTAGHDLLGEHPTVDVGLALVGKALGLPREAALTLFALGRSIGWIGHAIEQYEQGRLIRPRARYTGPPPA